MLAAVHGEAREGQAARAAASLAERVAEPVVEQERRQEVQLAVEAQHAAAAHLAQRVDAVRPLAGDFRRPSVQPAPS